MKKIDGKELHEIFEKLKLKNKDAYEELYEKYSTLVYQIAFSILKDKENAEDIMQNVFIKIANLSEEKLPSKYEASWLYTVTKNEAISYIRKNKQDMPIEEVVQKSSEDEIEKMLGENEFNQMLSFLEDTEKQIISLKVVLGLSFKEIANVLNMPIGTVQWKYYKSLHSLKLLIGNLSLFVISSVISVKAIFSKHKKETNDVLEEDKNEQLENIMIEEDNEQTILENSKVEEPILANKEEQIQEEIIEVEKTNNVTVLDIGLISLTSIFLCLTIYFTIICANYQQKRKKKGAKK